MLDNDSKIMAGYKIEKRYLKQFYVDFILAIQLKQLTNATRTFMPNIYLDIVNYFMKLLINWQ